MFCFKEIRFVGVQITDASSVGVLLKCESAIKAILADYYSNSAFWAFLQAFLSSVDIFQNLFFSKTSFRNTVRVSNSFDPDQARHIVGPDLYPKCLHNISADDTCRHSIFLRLQVTQKKSTDVGVVLHGILYMLAFLK